MLAKNLSAVMRGQVDLNGLEKGLGIDN